MLIGGMGKKESIMQKYEYVPQAEYKPIKTELESIIRQVQKIMEKKYDVPFRYQLIGSGNRHLITRVKGGNKGYDFDYNLIISAPRDDWSYNESNLKQNFINAFNTVLEKTPYSNAKDSTSAITIKVIDKHNSKIKYSCDFAIIYYDEDIIDNGYCYLKYNKEQNSYYFEPRSTARGFDDALTYVLGYKNGWNYIRDEYLKLKNTENNQSKRSFSLYIEAVKNVANRIYTSVNE